MSLSVCLACRSVGVWMCCVCVWLRPDNRCACWGISVKGNHWQVDGKRAHQQRCWEIAANTSHADCCHRWWCRRLLPPPAVVVNLTANNYIPTHIQVYPPYTHTHTHILMQRLKQLENSRRAFPSPFAYTPKPTHTQSVPTQSHACVLLSL